MKESNTCVESSLVVLGHVAIEFFEGIDHTSARIEVTETGIAECFARINGIIVSASVILRSPLGIVQTQSSLTKSSIYSKAQRTGFVKN